MLKKTVLSAMWARMPAITCGITSRPSRLRAEMLMCMPLPGWPGSGFGEKSAARPLCTAIVLTTARNVSALSAAAIGSE